MQIMPCGHNSSWMIRTSDRGIRYKICILCLCEGIGLTKDAYNTPLPIKFKKKEEKLTTIKKEVKKKENVLPEKEVILSEVKEDVSSKESSKGTN